MTNRTLRALIIEDEAIVAMLIEDLLEEMGCRIAASAATAREALELAQTCEVDFALLDVNLGDGQTSLEAADVLRDRAVPYAWLTGYGLQGVPPHHADAPLLHKPIHPGRLAAVIRGFA